MPERACTCRRSRLSDTAVTPSDWSMQNATVSRVRRIAADQRDVGAVQRRHDLRHAIGRVRRHDLPREIRGRGVRHGVMRVDDVEVMLRARPGRSSSPATARTAARGTADRPAWPPRGTCRRGSSRREAERRLGAEDVDVVSASRQLDGQLRRDDAAAARGRVADDADSHERGAPDGRRFSRSRRMTAHGRRSLPPIGRRRARRTARRGSRRAG